MPRVWLNYVTLGKDPLSSSIDHAACQHIICALGLLAQFSSSMSMLVVGGEWSFAMRTYPPNLRHERIIRLWHSSLSGPEIAKELGLACITVKKVWWAAKKVGKLPKQRRPYQGF